MKFKGRNSGLFFWKSYIAEGWRLPASMWCHTKRETWVNCEGHTDSIMFSRVEGSMNRVDSCRWHPTYKPSCRGQQRLNATNQILKSKWTESWLQIRALKWDINQQEKVTLNMSERVYKKCHSTHFKQEVYLSWLEWLSCWITVVKWPLWFLRCFGKCDYWWHWSPRRV